MLRTCGDIESNPGPCNWPTDSNHEKNINLGHVNKGSLIAAVTDPLGAHKDSNKFELIKNHILFYKYDLFSISETWLENSNLSTDFGIPECHSPRGLDTSRHKRGVYVSIDLPAERKSRF